ncbi:MAG: type II toxin-antitoxin system RelE/ParE family toxin [Candidatus Altiarchaeota archaeon]
MNFEVLVHRKARAYLDKLPEPVRDRIKNGLSELEDDPFTPRPKADILKLTGTKDRDHAYRLRVGDYRAVYGIEKKKVFVTLIFHRGKDYQEI